MLEGAIKGDIDSFRENLDKTEKSRETNETNEANETMVTIEVKNEEENAGKKKVRYLLPEGVSVTVDRDTKLISIAITHSHLNSFQIVTSSSSSS